MNLFSYENSDSLSPRKEQFLKILLIIFFVFMSSCLQFSENNSDQPSSNSQSKPSIAKPILTYKLDLTHNLNVDLGKIVKHPERYSAIKIQTSKNNQRYISLKSGNAKLGKISIQANGSSKNSK